MINIFAAALMLVVIFIAIGLGDLVYKFRQEKENKKKRRKANEVYATYLNDNISAPKREKEKINNGKNE